MNIQEAVKEVMKATGFTYRSLAEVEGSNYSSLSQRLNRGSSPRCDSVMTMLSAMKALVVVKDLIGKRESYELLSGSFDDQETNAAALVKEVMESKGYSYRALATKLGYPTASYVSEKVYGKKKCMSFDWFVRIMNGMDCEVLVVLDKQKWVITE